MTRFAKQAWRKVARPLTYKISDVGIANSWNMHRLGNVIPDLTGNGADLSKLGAAAEASGLLGSNIVFNDSGRYDCIQSQSLPWFNSLWVKVNKYNAANQTLVSKHLNTTSTRYFSLAHFNNNSFGIFDYGSLASNLLYRVAGSATPPTPWSNIIWGRSANNTIKMWINGVPSANNFVTTNPWADYNAGGGSDGLNFGAAFGAGGVLTAEADANIGQSDIYSIEMTDALAAEIYQRGARATQFATDWGHKADGIARGGGDTIGDGPFRIMVGDATSPACTTSSIAGQTVKTIKDTAGLNSRVYAKWSEFGVHSSETGYGSWCGWFYIPTGYAYVRWGLFWADSDIGGGGAGWRIDVANGFGIRLFRGGVGPVLTIPTVPLNQWFHLHVTRRYDGFWEIFVNGLSVGSVTNNAVMSGPYTGLESASIGSMVSLSDAHGGHALTKYLGVTPPNLG